MKFPGRSRWGLGVLSGDDGAWGQSPEVVGWDGALAPHGVKEEGGSSSGPGPTEGGGFRPGALGRGLLGSRAAQAFAFARKGVTRAGSRPHRASGPCPPRGVWLASGSSRKSGHRGCFRAQRAALSSRSWGSPAADTGLPRAPQSPRGAGGLLVSREASPVPAATLLRGGSSNVTLLLRTADVGG